MANVVTQTIKRYKDLDLNFTAHPIRKDVNTFVDELAVVNAIKNLILTNHYERPFHPEIGSNVMKMLFEPMDSITISVLQREIRQVIEHFEPRVKVEEMVLTPVYEENRIDVQMTFYIVNRTTPITIQFFLNRER